MHRFYSFTSRHAVFCIELELFGCNETRIYNLHKKLSHPERAIPKRFEKFVSYRIWIYSGENGNKKIVQRSFKVVLARSEQWNLLSENCSTKTIEAKTKIHITLTFITCNSICCRVSSLFVIHTYV